MERSTAGYTLGSDITVLEESVLVAYACRFHKHNGNVRLGISRLLKDGFKLYFTSEGLIEIQEYLDKVIGVANNLRHFPEDADKVARENGDPMLIEILRESYIDNETYKGDFLKRLRSGLIELEIPPEDARSVRLEEIILYAKKLRSKN